MVLRKKDKKEVKKTVLNKLRDFFKSENIKRTKRENVEKIKSLVDYQKYDSNIFKYLLNNVKFIFFYATNFILITFYILLKYTNYI